MNAMTYPVLDEAVSEKAVSLIKRGNYDEFIEIKEIKEHPSAFLFSKIRKNSWPLINLAVSENYTNKNYLGKLKIANYLLSQGADPNVCAPYGQSAFLTMLGTHNWLRATKAKYDVYLQTIIFAHEMVASYDIDVNLTGKDYIYPLDEALHIYHVHTEEGHEELAKVTRALIQKMLEKGARGERPEEGNVHEELKTLISSFSGKGESLHCPPALGMPDFRPAFEGEKLKMAETIWTNSQHQNHKVYRSIKILFGRNILHANWGYGGREKKAARVISSAMDSLDAAAAKEAKSLLKEMTKGYGKKPCYDEDAYMKLYGIFM